LLNGVTRTAARALGGLALDASSGIARAGEAARAALTGSTIGPATLRVHVVILSDEDGAPLTTPDALRPSLELANDVFTAEAGIRVRVAGIHLISEPAPPRALDPRANKLLLLDDVLGRTDFYRRHSAPVDLSSMVVGAPVTVIVVRHIAGRVTGCSLGISADWVIVQSSLFDPAQRHTYDETVLAHELGHALNLPHVRMARNLMFPASSPPEQIRGTELQAWQAAILNANRHVVPGVTG
jgi:hypothetical protein